MPVLVRGQIASVTDLRSWTIHGCELSADSSRPLPLPVHGRLRPLPVRGHGLYADVTAGVD
ncbi:MAG: hypothetical protein ABI042_02565 [Verrucomicrobiota bacterium]